MREVWAELSASMRALRENAGKSLRWVEAESGVGRGTLSQWETGKARPNRRIVEWYDIEMGGDGLLLSIFAEARGAAGPVLPRTVHSAVTPGDGMAVIAVEPVFGTVVAPGVTIRAQWTLHNTGTIPWRDRRLERIGARAGQRVLAGDATTLVPDCDPDGKVECETEVRVPDITATFVAHWHVVDELGRAVLPYDPALSIHIVAYPL